VSRTWKESSANLRPVLTRLRGSRSRTPTPRRLSDAGNGLIVCYCSDNRISQGLDRIEADLQDFRSRREAWLRLRTLKEDSMASVTMSLARYVFSSIGYHSGRREPLRLWRGRATFQLSGRRRPSSFTTG
jgi:hypothetical protein